MTWINVTSIKLQKEWQVSGEFEGQIIRLRHSVPENINFSYGLVAQSFGLNNNLELHNVKKIYPFNGDDILTVPNPFTGKQRIAIKGTNRYNTPQNWIVSIDVWTGADNVSTSQVQQIKQVVEQQAQAIATLTETVEILTGNPIQQQPYNYNTIENFFLIS